MSFYDRRSQGGSVSLLFLCFLLPVLLLSFWFALDVYRVVLERRVLQKRLDTGGLLALSYGAGSNSEGILRDSIEGVAAAGYSLTVTEEGGTISSELELETDIPFLSLLMKYRSGTNERSLSQRIESTVARKMPRYYLGINRESTAQEGSCFQASKVAAVTFYSLLQERKERTFSLLGSPVSNSMSSRVEREQREVCRITSLKEKQHRVYAVEDIISDSLLQSIAYRSPELWPAEALLWTTPLQRDVGSNSLILFLEDLEREVLSISLNAEKLITAVFFTSELLEADKAFIASKLKTLSSLRGNDRLKVSLFILAVHEKDAVYAKRFYQSTDSQAIEVALGSRYREKDTYLAILNHHESPYVQK